MIGSSLWWFLDEGTPSIDRNVAKQTDVIVVGAGASGLTAGYLLEREGFNVTILEAQDVYGGRMREAQDFADFPIDLGAEWIHEDPAVLETIVDDESVDVAVETIVYNPQSLFSWDGQQLIDRSEFADEYSEFKFKDTTWFNYFETYIVPTVRDKIVLSEPVSAIDYSAERVVVSTIDNQTFEPKNTYEADKVIVTVPISVLQNRYLEFTPELSQERLDAIDSITVPDGIKVFVEFDEKFYPDVLQFDEFSNEEGSQEKIYYDAAFKKDSNRNILGLFTIGEGASELVGLSDDEVLDFILAELDQIYEGAASRTYRQHIIQNWSSQQYVEGAYTTEFVENQFRTVETLREPLNSAIFFAGEALSFENQATVPGAAETGRDAVYDIIRSLSD